MAAANAHFDSFISKLDPKDKVPYPLTLDEAQQFLKDVLKMSDISQRLERNRLDFLDEFIHKMNMCLPFSSIVQFTAESIRDMKPPTLKECKSDVLSGLGGACFRLNTFSKALLDLYGFRTYHVGGCNIIDSIYDSHCAIIACDVSYPGSRHIVETGSVFPVSRAIPIDFEDQSPVYEFSKRKFKFIKADHGVVWLCIQVTEPYGRSSSRLPEGVFRSEGMAWKLHLCYWTSVPRSRTYFLERIKYRYRFPSVVPFILEGARLHARRDHGNSFLLASAGDKFALKNTSDSENILPQIMTEGEFLDFIAKEFPQYPRWMVVNAIRNSGYIRKMNNYSRL